MRHYARKLELFSMWVMIFGVIALCQPWNLFLHCYGATIIFAGLVLFNIFSRFKPRQGKPSPSTKRSSSV